MVILNKKECPVLFKQIPHPEYINLNIYDIADEEREAGLLNDILEAYQSENIKAVIEFYGDNLEFLKDNVHSNESTGKIIAYSQDPINIENVEILLAPQNNNCINSSNSKGTFFKKLPFYGKILYLSENAYQIFEKHFPNFDKGYDNLICLAMIVKNAGPTFENVLKANLPFIDRWCILDTGSTDGTQETIKEVLKEVKGTLYEEPFVNFKVSRNRCLDLCGTSCKFIVMLDDTYELKGNLRSFLHEVRGDQFSDSFSLMIQSDDTEYYSNRVIKSLSKLRYIHTIHEVITDQDNVNVTIPKDRSFIFDHRSDYMEQRTTDRKQFDLELLFQEFEDYPDDPRSLYYIAQTYGCLGDELNKAAYFEKRINHPVQGYIQEKIDACFELARTYNFKISPITKEPYIGPLTDQEWDICENLYTQAYSMDPKRPDSLYFLGIHSFLNNNYTEAYCYFKQAFEIGYPIGSQYSLKPTLSFHFLPKFLAEVCYYLKDFKLGEQASQLFLMNNSFNDNSWNLMSNWFNIHKHLNKLKVVESKSLDKPIFCFVTDGGWEPWTGSDIETKGMGGSETWIIETAKYISRQNNFHVIVFCKTDKPAFYENVGYNPIEMFNDFIGSTTVEYLIVSRYTEYVPVAIHGHAKKIGIIFHDNISPDLIIPIHPKIKRVWGLTEWHANCIKQVFPQFEKIIRFQNYGIDKNFNNFVKIKNSFIYSSFPNRGLVVLLRMWKQIRSTFSDATLHVYCNLEHKWTNEVAPEQMKEIKSLITQAGVASHGWVPKKVLAKAWSRSEYWFYPCIFEETFCLTALEAASSKTCIITNGLAALSETAKYGITVSGNPLTTEWQVRTLEKLKHILTSPNLRNTLVERNYQWVQSLTWESQTNKLLSDLE